MVFIISNNYLRYIYRTIISIYSKKIIQIDPHYTGLVIMGKINKSNISSAENAALFCIAWKMLLDE